MKTIQIFVKGIGKLIGIYEYSKTKYSGKKAEKYLELLRELIFVRAISVLEFFLIENIKEIFTLTKEPFKNYGGSSFLENKKILFSKSLSQLHSEIINTICRNLSSGGYLEIKKFYLKYFNIDFFSINLQTKIDLCRYYEERHLLVHKLGKTDKEYRKKYDTDAIKIKITEKDLKSAFKNFILFGRRINLEIKNKISVLNLPNQEKFERRVKISIFKIKEGSNILKRDYSFWANDEFVNIRDVLLEYLKVSENSFEIILGGNIKEVSVVMKKLKQEKRKEIINYVITEDLIQIKNPFNFEPKRINLRKEQIEEIKKKLPKQPWPSFIHKKIAKEMNVSNGQVSAVIQHLIREGIFKHQIDGKVVEDIEKRKNGEFLEKL
jgi:hypothetical protein